MELVSTPDYPPTFSEKAPRVSTVPVYMRIREHHCISPQTPVDVGGFQHGIDDELGSAYFPPMQMNGSGVCTDTCVFVLIFIYGLVDGCCHHCERGKFAVRDVSPRSTEFA